MRHSSPWAIEQWRPFADRRLHEFLFAIPPDQKFEPHPETDEFYAGSKWLVRRALRGLLPEPIRTRRTKTVFTSGIGAHTNQQWTVYEEIFGPGSQPQVAARGYVDQDRFCTRLEGLRSGIDLPDLIWVLQIIGLEIWLRAVALPREQFVVVPPAVGDATSPTHASAIEGSMFTR